MTRVVHQAMLFARLLLSENPGGAPNEKSKWMSARDILEMATLASASVPGPDDIGSHEPINVQTFSQSI